MMIEIILIIIVSFLSGSIPFGVIIARSKGIDLTKTGSGNVGATNVFRTLGKIYGILVFFLDFLKGAIPVWIAKAVFVDPWLILACGLLAILGHMFSPFLKFKGGKGVATGLGVIFAIAPYICILAFLLGISIIATTGYVSVASITGSILLTILLFRGGQPLPYAFLALIATVFIIYKHIPNIKRLAKGTENKISWNK